MKKHTLYLILTTLLRLMLSFAAHVIVLVKRGGWEMPGELPCMRYLAMPTRAQFSVVVTGIIAGYFIGKRWWQIVYVEKRHWSRWGKKK